MIAIRCGIALSFVCAAVPVALLVVSTPAAAKPSKNKSMVEVGPIWNQQDAEKKCAKAARRAGGTWTGVWRTTRPGQMSVCEIRSERGGPGRTVEVGPIWNQQDAERKCPKAARAAGGTWTGVWRTTRPGQMSVCEIARGGSNLRWPETRRNPGPVLPGRTDERGGGGRTVEVGPIWNQMDAERKCPEAARAAGATWTGVWRTTRPGQMSVCEIKR